MISGMTPLEQILLAKQEKKFAEDEVMDRLELAVAVANNTISPAEARKALELSSSGQIYTMLGLAIMSGARKGLCRVTITGERYPEDHQTTNVLRPLLDSAESIHSARDEWRDAMDVDHPWAKPILAWIEEAEKASPHRVFCFTIGDLIKVVSVEDSRGNRIMIGSILAKTKSFERFRGPRANRGGRGDWFYKRAECPR